MPAKRTTNKKAKRPQKRFLWHIWPRFSDKRSSKIARGLLEENHVNMSVPGGSTYRFAIEEIAKNASHPIALEALCDELKGSSFVRGAVFFGPAGDQLDKIVGCYDDMQWWISDKGLNVAILPPENPELSSFDQLAGSLTAEHWIGGKLSNDALSKIAEALDQAAFSLKSELQRAQWRPIAQHNSKFSRNPIKTFREAVQKPILVRFIRRRLYLARVRFEKAQLQAAHSRLVD